MKVCKNCRNGIPDGMKICPHCEKLPPRTSNVILYLVLTLVAFAAAVYFRPFANADMLEKTSQGMLWVAFVIFIVFGAIFAFACISLLKACKRVPEDKKLTRLELMHFKNVRKHISIGRHYYGADGFCAFCGQRKKKK